MIGEMVLLKIREGAVRPFLIVAYKDGLASGEVFFDVEEDRGTEWVRENIFNPPWQQCRTAWVRDLREGRKVGEWQKRPVSVLAPKPPQARR